MKDRFSPARFITTALWPEQYPKILTPQGVSPPEIAVAGRSNVGKSSLLNNLFKSDKLVKTSSTPGKTQALNFFLTAEEVVFVDLPGYGYAQVPVALRRQWGPMIHKYLTQRQQLKAILLLIDIRRLPQEEEFMMISWAEAMGKPLLVVLTKIDKLNQSERVSYEKAIKEKLPPTVTQILSYSVTKNFGRKELCSVLNNIITKE